MTGGQQKDASCAFFVSFNEPESLSPAPVSGVGHPSSSPGATPGKGDNSYTSTSPSLEGKQMVDSSTQTLSYCVNSFSSKTCNELLTASKLSVEQIQFEANYIRSLSHKRIARFNPNIKPKILSQIQLELKSNFADNICIDFEAAATSHDLTLSHFSCLVEEAQKQVDELVALNARVKDWPPVPGKGVPYSDDGDSENLDRESDRTGDTLPESVCSLVEDSNFEELSVSEILQQIPITEPSSHGRKVVYFGKRGYNYGNTHHEPKDYPDCAIMTSVTDILKSKIPDFNTDDYSCLLTYYPDGRATIPAHSDNETNIKSDSQIYTISVGATRELEFVDRVGPLSEHRVKLEHGSILVMSAQSQSDWSHELLFDPAVHEPRISFTFRHIVDPPVKSPAPPMQHEPPPQTAANKHRILFVTDSILSSTPEHIFGRINGHRCIRKKNYYLTDLTNFEHEFEYSKYIILAMGLNDLSTHKDSRNPQMSGQALAQWASRKFKYYCSRYSDSTFVVSSILHTRRGWLNSEVNIFNRMMYQLACIIPNLEFLDSHAALTRDPISQHVDYVLDKSDSRGTHLTLGAKRLISNQLVHAVELLDGRNTGKCRGYRIKNWTWPLRQWRRAVNSCD